MYLLPFYSYFVFFFFFRKTGVVVMNSCSFFFYFFKDFTHLFLQRGEGKEKERERNINMWLPLARPQLRTWPAAQACDRTGNQTCDPLVHSPLSHTSQGSFSFFLSVKLFNMPFNSTRELCWVVQSWYRPSLFVIFPATPFWPAKFLLTNQLAVS